MSTGEIAWVLVIMGGKKSFYYGTCEQSAVLETRLGMSLIRNVKVDVRQDHVRNLALKLYL